jgi:hypothetical protein
VQPLAGRVGRCGELLKMFNYCKALNNIFFLVVWRSTD